MLAREISQWSVMRKIEMHGRVLTCALGKPGMAAILKPGKESWALNLNGNIGRLTPSLRIADLVMIRYLAPL